MEFVGRADDDEGLRDLYVGCLSALTDWRGLSEDETWRRVVEGETEGFALFLAMDGSKLSTTDIAEFASYMIDHGLFWVSVWGPDCERVHDIFDEVDVGQGLSVDHPVVMSTWPPDRPGPARALPETRSGGPTRLSTAIPD